MLLSAGVKVISQPLNIYEYLHKECVCVCVCVCVCAGEIFESVCLIFIVFTQNLWTQSSLAFSTFDFLPLILFEFNPSNTRDVTLPFL